MRRNAFILIVGVSLALAPALADQKKPKDEFLYQYLVGEFAQLSTKLGQLDARVTLLDTDLAQLKQQHSGMGAEFRESVRDLKSTENSLSTRFQSTQQDLDEVNTRLRQVHQDVAELTDLVRRNSAQAPKPDAAPPAPVTLDGYITGLEDNEVTINLGTSAGVRVGQQFGVFKTADPHTEVAVIEVTQIMNDQNSRAKILSNSANVPLQFSDIVRPK
ncbi:MAG: hypothetical protein ACRD50_13105 [Candidatus Acidiferrales bacterium]